MLEHGILEINTEDIAYYLQCPLRFKLDGWKNISPPPEEPEYDLDTYIFYARAEVMRFIMSSYAFTGQVPNYRTKVRRFWYKLWKYIFEYYGDTDEIKQLYVNNSLLMYNHYDKFCSNVQGYTKVPFFYDYQYKINYDNVDICGKIDFLLKTDNYYGTTIDLCYMPTKIMTGIHKHILSNYNLLFGLYKLREELTNVNDRILYFSHKGFKWRPIKIPYTNDDIYKMLMNVCNMLRLRISYRNPGPYCRRCVHHKKILCEF